MYKKTILINASNIISGGAKSYVEWFLKNQNKFNFKLKFLINKKSNIILKNKSNIIYSNCSPSRSLNERKKIKLLAEKINPDLVFTLFGPSYVNFKHNHLVGVGDGWVYENNFDVFSKVYKNNIFLILKKKLEILYKKYYFQNGNYFFTESENLKNKIIKSHNINRSRIFVLKNLDPSTIHTIKNIKKLDKLKKKFFKQKDTKYILYLTSYRLHKNFEYIFKLNDELVRKKKDKIKFVFTLKDKDFFNLKKKFNLKNKNIKNFINLGEVNFIDIPNIYKLIDISILPSFIETFSSNIIESTSNNKIILLSNISNHLREFGNNFEYLDLNNTKVTAEKIQNIFNNTKFKNKILKKQNNFIKNNKSNRLIFFNKMFKNLTNN